ncbi:transposable element Tcb1 transposase [Trichonephila clavipes]|nr:transposable element Tcb1 transposase [Trichonephila clavipes]
MDWPILTGLESIEHVGDMLSRRTAAHQHPPTCTPELRRALLDEWCNIPQDQIDNLILSMPRRCNHVSMHMCNLKILLGIVFGHLSGTFDTVRTPYFAYELDVTREQRGQPLSSRDPRKG